ncbi:MAG: alpha/beta hydrolase [Chloroflexota bacterium]
MTHNPETHNPETHNPEVAYGASTLPAGIRSRFLQHGNGLNVHFLEAGFETPNRPCVLLLHGFPELAYSWRKQMLPLAEAGYHVIAPDQRGYGRTVIADGHWDGSYDGELSSFRMFNKVRDVLSLVYALGYTSVAAAIGHDYGSPVAAYCALLRPDVFRSVTMMSAPFGGPPSLPTPQQDITGDTGDTGDTDDRADAPSIHDDLAALPRPRKHYQYYYSMREANDNMHKAAQGVHDFLRAYYHHKSADWVQNKPYRLEAWSATELAKMPTYYIMDLAEGMAETVAKEMPSPEQVATCAWMTEEELRVYSSEYERTSFQGGLQSYRCGQDPRYSTELELFANRTIDVPACFISGASDWGVYQRPASFERMQTEACTQMTDVHFVEGAGHWVQQEQPDAVNTLLSAFLQNQR